MAGLDIHASVGHGMLHTYAADSVSQSVEDLRAGSGGGGDGGAGGSFLLPKGHITA